MTKKHHNIDARIMEFIAQGATTFPAIVASCASAAWLVIPPDRPARRTIERRLQVLRKAGKIEHANPWWKIVEVEK